MFQERRLNTFLCERCSSSFLTVFVDIFSCRAFFNLCRRALNESVLARAFLNLSVRFSKIVVKLVLKTWFYIFVESMFLKIAFSKSARWRKRWAKMASRWAQDGQRGAPHDSI